MRQYLPNCLQAMTYNTQETRCRFSTARVGHERENSLHDLACNIDQEWVGDQLGKRQEPLTGIEPLDVTCS